ncbi:ATP-grasp domain-containing protein [Patescibacteria group bacterium]|nr:ATP-grasp domain-containing protein [Patescibacteria group bacterium]
MKKDKKKIKIAVFFGGRLTKHLRLIKEAAEKLNVEFDNKIRLDLVSYNRIVFDSENGEVMIRGDLSDKKAWKSVRDYDVLFFRTTGKHWEEVDLIINSIKGDDVVVVDPLVRHGKPSYACKAYQMLALKQAGIEVPRSLYGSLQYLRRKAKEVFEFPLIIKGSGGDRGTRVFKADNQVELNELVSKLRVSEIREGRRYMAQEYIENDGDYRVIVLGDKVLGVMKRNCSKKGEFRNNYSAGGVVELADLPDNIKDLAVKAARACGLLVAGVDVAFRDYDKSKPVIWEVNKGPQFSGFMKATGIDVPREIVKFLRNLTIKDNKNASLDPSSD